MRRNFRQSCASPVTEMSTIHKQLLEKTLRRDVGCVSDSIRVEHESQIPISQKKTAGE